MFQNMDLASLIHITNQVADLHISLNRSSPGSQAKSLPSKFFNYMYSLPLLAPLCQHDKTFT